jgi:hypothetical protein
MATGIPGIVNLIRKGSRMAAFFVVGDLREKGSEPLNSSLTLLLT